MGTPRHADIEVDEDMGFQRRSWRVQRVGRVFVFLFVAAALSGLFGGGGVAQTEAHSSDGALAVEYRRFARNHADAELTVRVQPRVAAGDTVRVWLSRPLLQAMDVERVTPAPVRSTAGGERVSFEFAATPDGGPVEILFHCRTREPGPARGRVGVDGAGDVEIRQFVFP